MNSFSVISVNISSEKGTPKTPVERILLKENYGVVGDAHAGEHDRQVSILASEDISVLRNEGVVISFGDMAENITTIELDTGILKPGFLLTIGNAELIITQIGKECHGGCAIMKKSGRCIMPKRGLFAKVIKGGIIKNEDKGYYSI